MTSLPLIIYHGNCQDGFGAAWAFWRKFKGEAEFLPAIYGSEPPEVTGRTVYLIDFSFPRPIVEKLLETVERLTVIDHHKTALEDLETLKHPRFFPIFDNTRSGAGLAWDYLFDGQPRPWLINAIEDRDLWRFRLDDTLPISQHLFALDYDFQLWDKIIFCDYPERYQFIKTGEAIVRHHMKNTKELLELTRRSMTIGGHKVPVACMPYMMASDAGNIMAENAPFAATYYDTESHRIFSLRSTPKGMDVSSIAKGYGGGGHRNASGFRVPRDHPLAQQ